MIISFYDKDLNPLFNNASLVIDENSFNLVKRPVEFNDFRCVCEPISEDIQPTFLVVKDDLGREILYSSLAGIPQLNNENKTEINGTDLKSILSCDILKGTFHAKTIKSWFDSILADWLMQVYLDMPVPMRIFYEDGAGDVQLDLLKPEVVNVDNPEDILINVYDEISSYLKAYDLYLEVKLTFEQTGENTKKYIDFVFGKLMQNPKNIKLWEHDIKNFGKWLADTNETQPYYLDENGKYNPLKDENGNNVSWILTSNNEITVDKSKRNIFPIKKKVVVSNESIEEANKEALILLLESRYNENIELSKIDSDVDFKTKFNIFVKDNFYTKENSTYYAKVDIEFKTPLGTFAEIYKVKSMKMYYGIIEVNGIEYIVKESDIENIPYKSLPCGELRYNASSYSIGNGVISKKPYEIQIGYRYTGVDFI